MSEKTDWVEERRPDVTDKPEYGVLLKEFKSGSRRPSVYILWERTFGSVDKLGMVCICSTRDLAEKRVRAMNSSTFWSREDIRSAKRYLIEECEIDHLFAAEMMGYDIESDKSYDSMARSTIGYFMDESRYENLRKYSRDRIEELEAQLAAALSNQKE